MNSTVTFLAYRVESVLQQPQRMDRPTMKNATRARIDADGRLVIPASIRKELGINAGDELILRIDHDELRITSLRRRLEHARGLVREHIRPGTSLVDELIAERHGGLPPK